MAKSINLKLIVLMAAAVILVSSAGRAVEPCCTVPDNGTGTAGLPPMGCTYQSYYDHWEIVDGLPGVIRQLTHAEYRMRAGAAFALGKIGDKQALAPFFMARKSSSSLSLSIIRITATSGAFCLI